MMILTCLTYIFLRSKLYLEIKVKEKKSGLISPYVMKMSCFEIFPLYPFCLSCPMHNKTRIDFLLKITVSPFNFKVNYEQIF